MPTRLPPDDGAPFIAMLELAAAAGDADIIEASMDRLETPIAQYQERIHEPAKLQHAARVIRDGHERPADKRLRRQTAEPTVTSAFVAVASGRRGPAMTAFQARG